MFRRAEERGQLKAWPTDAAFQPDSSSNTASQIITATIEQGLVKNDPDAPDSRRYARYIPAWA